MKQLSLLLLFAFLFLATTFEIKNAQHEVPLQNAQDYTNYIKTIKGLINEQTLSENPQLAKIVQDERISLLNSVEDIVLVLVDNIKENSENLPSGDDLINIHSLEELTGGFDVMSLVDFEEKTVEEKISQLEKAGKVVHTLEISNELAKQFEAHTERKLFESEEGIEESESTVHKQTQTVKAVKQSPVKSASYILKFFFSFVFIIVCLGSLAAIANMDNKKDTLLYAKFIADVGQR